MVIFTAIPKTMRDKAIAASMSACDTHACPYIAVMWSPIYPAAFTGFPTRTRLCEIHARRINES